MPSSVIVAIVSLGLGRLLGLHIEPWLNFLGTYEDLMLTHSWPGPRLTWFF